MGFDPKVRQNIVRAAVKAKEKMSETDVFLSPNMRQYLEGLAMTLSGQKKEVHVIADGPDGITAYTNGNRIVLNCESEFVSEFATELDRWIAFMGMFYHEMSHCLYMDFGQEDVASGAISNGRMYGREPEVETDEMKERLNEVLQAMQDPDFVPVFQKIFHDIDNSFADRHDEDCIMSDYGGLCTAGIAKAREALLNQCEVFDETEEKLQKGDISPLAVFFNTLLQYSRFETVLMIDDSLWEKSDILKKLSNVMSEIELASWTDKLEERYTAMNRIVLELWPYIKDFMKEYQKQQNQQNGQSGQQSQSSSQGSSQSASGSSGQQNGQSNGQKNGQSNGQKNSSQGKAVIQAVLDQLAQGAKKAGQTQTPQNVSTAPSAKKPRAGKKQEKAAGQNGQQEQKSAANAQDALDKIKSDMAEASAESQYEQQAASDVLVKVNAVNQSSTHKSVGLIAGRCMDENRDLYDSIIKDIRPYSKRLQKYIEDALKDMKDGALAKHKPYGNVLRIQDTYRPDGLCYARKKLPQDLPDMAVTILVDNSGSMGGQRIAAAVKAATMLYDFATGLNIPVAVAGHNTFGPSCSYTVYSDFERANDKDKYRICSMRPGGCNRDGMALEIAASLLNRRSEEFKLLMLISDGQPNHTGYGGEMAAKDIQSIIRRYRGKGVEILAAGIGEDRDMLKPIYGDAYVDISDLSLLPKKLTSLVRKRIMAQM